MPLFSQVFNLHKSQHELDFVDIPVDGDILLFVDPYAISQRVDDWSKKCNRAIISFFQRVIDAIISGNIISARELLRHLHEPNETRLGFSSKEPQGAGLGKYQSEQLLNALTDSTAVRTGFINYLEEAEILIDGVGRDKISDLSTNIIRKYLAEYTKEQCTLHNIPIRNVPLNPFYSVEDGNWISDYFELPIAEGKPVLLVPKIIVRYDPAYNYQNYYHDIVLSFLRVENLDANSSLVNTLKNGQRIVYKKDLIASFPCTKENLYRFSRDHPEEMERYRDLLALLEQQGKNQYVGEENEKKIAEALISALSNISTGSESASEYHRMMIGIVEFLFFPNLIYPKKEVEINQGRKRIDITMENGSRKGVFFDLHNARNLPCSFVPFECKNYGTDISNPELDQLAGRLSPTRGRFGILCCRAFQDKDTFIERCRDNLREERGLVISLDDQIITELLRYIADGNREGVDLRIRQLINDIWLS